MITSHILERTVKSWLDDLDWQCIRSVQKESLPKIPLDIYGYEDVSSLINESVAFVNRGNYAKRLFPVVNVLIFQSILAGSFKNIQGPTLVVTQSLSNISTLWHQSKVFDLIVLEKNKILTAYTWNPYNHDQCNKAIPDLKVISKCKNGLWQDEVPRFRKKLPRNFEKCPLRIVRGTCAALMTKDWQGADQCIYDSLGDFFNFSLVYKEVQNESFFSHIKSNGQPGGGTKILYDQDADLATGCMGLVGEKYRFINCITPHVFDSLSWFVPTPRMKPNYSNIYTGFPVSLWLVITSSFLAFVSLFILLGRIKPQSSYKSLSVCFMNSFANLIGCPTSLENGLSQMILSLLNFYSLHIIVFYESMLLVNLFQPSMEAPITTPWEGLAAGLKPIFRYQYSSYLNISDEPIMRHISATGNYEIEMSPNFTYGPLIYEKIHMLLALKYVDEALIRNYHHEFDDLVRVLDPAFQNYPYCVYSSPGNPLAPLFRLKITQLQEGGFIQYWKETYLASFFKRRRHIYEANKPISLETLQSSFYLLTVGLILSLSLFLFEKLLAYIFYFSPLRCKLCRPDSLIKKIKLCDVF